MANIRDLNNRIATLKNMQKVMRAMNMIASVKLRKLFRLQHALSFFEKSLNSITRDMRAALKNTEYPLIKGYAIVKKAHVIVFTADKGLCGSHNSSVLGNLDTFIKDKEKNNIAVDVTCIGLRGVNFCRRRGYEIAAQTEINDKILDADVMFKLSSQISLHFQENKIQEVYVIANYFISTLQQDTLTAKLIPLELIAENDSKEKYEFNPLIEPELNKFVAAAREQYLYYKLMSALENSYLSEQSARMTAMENATKNSEDMINHYGKLQNRVRQAAITNDLIEIVSGKEALKG